jgi:hypothetical protein
MPSIRFSGVIAGSGGPSLRRRQPPNMDAPDKPKATKESGQIVGWLWVIAAPNRSAIATTGKLYWSRKKQAKSSRWVAVRREEIKPGQ